MRHLMISQRSMHVKAFYGMINDVTHHKVSYLSLGCSQNAAQLCWENYNILLDPNSPRVCNGIWTI